MKIKVKLLNDAGINEFLSIHKEIIENYSPRKIGKKGAPISLGQINRITDIISNKSCVENMEGYNFEVDNELSFSSKIELGKYLCKALEGIPAELKDCDGLWSWLALVYFKQLLQVNEGEYELHSDYRYIFKKSNGFKYMRHSVYFSYFAYMHLGDDSIVFLHQQPNISGEFTNWAARTDVLTNHAFVKMCCTYFFDPNTKKYARDFTNSKKTWNVMNMFKITVPQLKMNYDLHACDVKRLFELLPEPYKNRSFKSEST